MVGPGVIPLSDPVDLAFAPLADLAVSLYITDETGPTTIQQRPFDLLQVTLRPRSWFGRQ
jgi:hypothetical protein